LTDGILPSVIKQLNAATTNLKVVKVARSDDDMAEITLVESDSNTRRHTVHLINQTCSCRKWQVSGKPCNHALAWICSNRGVEIKDFVSEYFSVGMFRAAYAGRVPTMPDRSQWPVVNLGFKVCPPRLKRGVGRPRVTRIRGALEGQEGCDAGDAMVLGTLPRLAKRLKHQKTLMKCLLLPPRRGNMLHG
jgi:hypothetical protein